jgi:hypothetical protein
MTFREFMQLDEQPTVAFDGPTSLLVTINGKPQKIATDLIDVRAEDWTATPVRTADGVVLQMAPKQVTGFTPFSLPLANGQYINKDSWKGTEISDEPTTRTICRKDWADFAQFILNNKVVKEPLHQRATDARLAV